MQPIRETSIDVQFASQLSPWWLLLLLPAAALAAWVLYRRQWRDVTRPHAIALLVLRALLLVLVVLLAFKPSLVLREIVRWPGRVLFLIDNSESMTARDSGYTDAEALRLARQLGRAEAVASPANALADLAENIAGEVRRFRRFAAETDRGRDVFWERAEKVQGRCLELFEQITRDAAALRDLPEADQRLLAAALAELTGLRSELSTFFAGETNPPARTWERYLERLVKAKAELIELQARLDNRAIAGGDTARKALADRIRGENRLDLVAQVIADAKAGAAERLPGQFLRAMLLMSGERDDLAALDAETVAAAGGPTPILERLDELVREENPFPLTGVVLLSDGRDLTGRSLEAVAQALARAQVPVLAGGAGSVREPADIAVLEVTAPPFGVKGVPLNVRVRLKTALAEPVPLKVAIVREEKELTGEEVMLGERSRQTVTLRFAPADMGLFRYSVRVAAASGEVFPVRNNRADFAVDVREDRVRVLLLDWEPRWETRFALNILQRLDYIELNSIIVLAEEGQRLRRGVQKGTWPQDAATLEMYDLIVLGDLPEGLLTEPEWETLRLAVEEKGKTLCWIGTGRGVKLPDSAGLRDVLLPVQPASQTVAVDEELSDLRVTAAGKLHPVTRRLAAAVPDGRTESDMPRADTQVLALVENDGPPLISTRFSGKGKVLLIDSEMLWRRLNEKQLSAHAGIYLNLVTWALSGGIDTESEDGPRLALDQHMLTTGQPMQVWLIGASTDSHVEVLVDGEAAVAEALARPYGRGGVLQAARFSTLPAGRVTLRLKEAPSVTSAPVQVIDDNPELRRLGQDETFLRRLAEATGGHYGSFAEAERLLDHLKPRVRVERRERVWQLWDAAVILALVFSILTLEWIWRKLVGLV